MIRQTRIAIVMLTLVLATCVSSVTAEPRDEDKKSETKTPPATSGFLGGKFGIIDDDTAEELGLSAPGAMVFLEVVEDSPAEKAGLQTDDVIIAIDDQPIADRDAFIDRMSTTKPGQVIKITVLREKEQHDIDVTLGERPKNFPTSQPTTRP